MKTSNRIGAALTMVLAAATVGIPTSCAQPRGFPDLSKFTEIAVDSPVFRTNRVGGYHAAFATPDGLLCDADYESQWCMSDGLGVIPGFPSNIAHVTAGQSCRESEEVVTNDKGPEFVHTQNCEGTAGVPVLHPGQKVTVGKTGEPIGTGKVTCVVGDNRLTACTNGSHGFVIQPSGSWTF